MSAAAADPGAQAHAQAPGPGPAAPPPPGLLRLAWPIFAEQSLHILNGVVDTLLAAHLADQAAAGLASAWQIVVVFLIGFNVLSVGASIVTTHHLGAGDTAGARRLAREAIATNLWLGLAFSLLLASQAHHFLNLVQVPPALMPYALPFLQWMGGTLFLESMNFALAAVLRAHARTREVMWVMGAQNVLNFMLAATLMFGLFGAPQLGVVGAALATAGSRLVACIALWGLASRLLGVRLLPADLFRISWTDVRRLLKYGGPAVGENLSWWTAYMLITALTARMGAQQLATQTYVMQVAMVVMLFGISVGIANEILIGRLVGAGQLDEAYTLCLKNMRLGLTWTMVVAVAAALASPWLIRLFTQDPVIVQAGIVLIVMGLVLEPGRSFNLIMINALRASGDTRFPMVAGLVSQWLVMALGGWLLGTVAGLGLLGVWIAFTADEWLRGLLMLQRWRRRRWVKHANRAQAHAQAAVDGPLQDPHTLPPPEAATPGA